MLKYYICYIHGNQEKISCHEAFTKDGLLLFRNASGQIVLAVPLTNVAYVKLLENE